MSNRERWIVYPILFFSLAVALRANLLLQWMTPAHEQLAQSVEGQLAVGQLVCDSVIVRQTMQLGDGETDPLVVLGKLDSGRGALWFNTPEGERALTMTTDEAGGGAIQVDSAAEDNRVMLSTSGLDIFGAEHQPLAVFGRRPDGTGGLAILLNGEGKQQLQLDGGGEAGRITSLNSSGQPLLSLTHRKGEAGAIVLLTEEQRPLVSIGGNVENSAGVVEVYGTEPTPQVRLTSAEDAGVVVTYDSRGTVLTSLQHDGAGGGLVRVGATGGNTVVALGVERREKAGVVQVFDPKGRPMVTMTSEQGGGTVETRNVRGNRLVGLDHTVAGEGVVSMYDARGERFIAAAVNPATLINQNREPNTSDQPGEQAGESDSDPVELQNQPEETLSPATPEAETSEAETSDAAEPESAAAPSEAETPQQE